ncbi:bifunctional diguanylate cyclase/phosphodiesterase [Novosphingobium sp. BL-8A]|uniref:putative bifunctional diguanylate cyclase/phosphodiesterase n=1 Tax=Novosphingobium sp. BL-8A TaxID=3127639 RepID=UPI00375835AC
MDTPRHYRVAKRSTGAIIAIIAMTLGGAGALWAAGTTLNHQASQRQVEQVRDAIGRARHNSEEQAKGLGQRLELARQLAANGADGAAGWLDEELGQPITSTVGTKAVLIVGPDGPLYGFSEHGRASTREMEELSAAVADIARPLPAERQQRASAATTDIRSINGNTAIVSAAPIASGGMPLDIVTFTYLDDPTITRWGHAFLLDRFALFSPYRPVIAGWQRQPLESIDGETIGNLVWVSDRPGDVLTHYVLPAELVFGAIILALFWSIARKARTSISRASFLERFDPVTGLVNRATFMHRLDQIAGNHPCQLLRLDIDDFSAINDAFGLRGGDEVIREFSKQLVKVFSADRCMIARLDGDEFAILVVGAGQIHSLGPKATQVSVKKRKRGHPTTVATLCAGIVAAPEHGHTATDLMQNADIALGAAKAAGTARHVIYDPTLGLAFKSRKDLEAQMKQAIDDQGFELFYQPIVDLRTMRPSGVEALLRLKEGAATPAEFVPVIEKLGLMPQLGEWIIAQAFADSRKWLGLRTSINLSPLQLENPALLGQIDFNRARYNISPQAIGFEITEGILLADSDTVRANLMGLRQRGYSLALDDFGTGYSSLSYLSEFDIQRLKLDKSFVSGGRTQSERSAALVQGVIDICHRLGIQVVAEGIEEEDEARILQGWSCDFAQGYYFGRPAPVWATRRNLATLKQQAAALIAEPDVHEPRLAAVQ